MQYVRSVDYGMPKKIKNLFDEKLTFENMLSAHKRARKNKAFIIYMNGQVAEASKWNSRQIEPGCEIVVPTKDKTKADKWNIQTILGVASSIGSLGLTAASLANILK